MKKKVICVSVIVAFLLIIIVGILFLGKKSTDMKLYVQIMEWNGWQGTTDVIMERKEFSIQRGKRLFLDNDSGRSFEKDLSFVIYEIKNDSVILKTSSPMSENGIDLTSKKTKFTLNKNQELKLYTLTYDAGGIYVFELK